MEKYSLLMLLVLPLFSFIFTKAALQFEFLDVGPAPFLYNILEKTMFNHLNEYIDLHYGNFANLTQRDVIYNQILLLVIQSARKKFPAAIGATLRSSEEGTKFGFKLDKNGDFVEAVSSVDEKIRSYVDHSTAVTSMKALLEMSWDVVETMIRRDAQFNQAFINEAIRIVNDENILFLYVIPEAIPTGIGNVLKGLISILSIHKNSKVKNFEGYVLGNYSRILDNSFVYDELRDSSYSTEKLTTYRWLILANEENHFDQNSIFGANVDSMKLPDNPRLLLYWAKQLSIDFEYDASLIPTIVRTRILNAIRRLKFSDLVINLVGRAVDKMIHPSIGITVRTWTALHERSDNINLSRNFSVSAYISTIVEAVATYRPKSLIIAFDNEIYKADFMKSLKKLPLEVHFFDHAPDIDPLVKAAVELLSLSECNIVVGSRQSSFLEAVYWFGKLKPLILHPNEIAPEEISNSASGGLLESFVADDFDGMLENLLITDNGRFARNKLFPHSVFDNFFDYQIVSAAAAEYPTHGLHDRLQPNWEMSSLKVQNRKIWCSNEKCMGPFLRTIISKFKSQSFIIFLEKLTGIKGLLPDPKFYGSGLHQLQSGGHLSVHADFTLHEKRKDIWRRVNLIFYLNENWNDSWGGHLELWNSELTEVLGKYAPILNRLIIFSTSNVSFHGIPQAIKCPPETTRKSLTLYYYTTSNDLQLSASTTKFVEFVEY